MKDKIQVEEYIRTYDGIIGKILEDEDKCYLSRGYAVEDYASKILRKKYPIPKYMKKDLTKFIKKQKTF